MPETALRGALDSRLVLRPSTASDAPHVAQLLASEVRLDTTFEPGATWVAEENGAIVATCRVRSMPGAGSEIASVVVVKGRRGLGIGERLATRLLVTAPRPVFALAIAPGFFDRLGFVTVAKDALPAALLKKAETTCKSVGFVPMVLE